MDLLVPHSISLLTLSMISLLSAVLSDLNKRIEAAIAANDYDQAEIMKREAEGYPVIIIPFR